MTSRRFALVLVLLVGFGIARISVNAQVNPPQAPQINAVPFEFDPQHLEVVAAEWKGGIGCLETFDPVCLVDNDPQDKFVAGLLLVKSGLTSQLASAGVSLTGVKGIALTELGYDIRKRPPVTDDNGSHCGAGAPRFNVVTNDGVTHFVGCNSPPGVATPGIDWIRLRWDATLLSIAAFPPIPKGSPVASISIVFDEGQDVQGGPDQFGLAVLDNIDVNGQLIGTGPRGPAK